MRISRHGGICLFILMTLTAIFQTPAALGQDAPLAERERPIRFDSGEVLPHGDDRSVVFTDVVHVPDATWLRMRFDRAQLGRHAPGGQPTMLRITSLTDGAVQQLDHESLRQWQYTSAYFNGDALLIEIIADSNAGPSYVAAEYIVADDPTTLDEPGRAICGDTDDRELSDDPRAGRIAPVGCTGWLIDDSESCLLTAGHCGPSAGNVMQFNVPLSNSNGSWNHPPPADQYPIDPASIRTNGGGGVGNDWAYYGCFPNSNTGLSAFEAQGDRYQLAIPPTDIADQHIRITGYGSTSSPVPPEWNAAQKTHVGDFVSNSGTTLQYATDTTGGNSGSPIIHEETGFAVGIHTHGGCGETGGANNGTNIDHPNLQAALAEPHGICAPPPPLLFDFPESLPESVDPAGQTLLVEITGNDGAALDMTTPTLHYDIGEGLVSVPMTPSVRRGAGGSLFSASLPTTDCATIIRYFFSAMTTAGEAMSSPADAPVRTHDAVSAASIEFSFADDFETDTGWLVETLAADGGWERGIPAGDGLRGDPTLDADGSGQCWLTDNVAGNSDVDDGSTVLTSPAFDGTDPLAILSYWTWLSNDLGDGPETDALLIEISDDDGASWQVLESVGPTGPEVSGGWFHKLWRLDSIAGITPSTQMRLRVTSDDSDPQSIVEAGFDGVAIVVSQCPINCVGDVTGDDGVGLDDLLAVLANWGTDGSIGGDTNDDGNVGLDDLLSVLSNWGGSC